MNAPDGHFRNWRRAFRLPQSRVQIDRELDDEFRFHIEGRIEHFMATGLTRDEAQREVQKRFGDYQSHLQMARAIDEDTMRQHRKFEFVDMLVSETRLSLRALVRTPGFSLITIVTLALGIGATAAIYSVLDAVMLRPLPYRNSAQLVSVLHPATVPGSGERKWGVSPGGYFEFKKRANSVSDFGLYSTGGVTITNGGRADVARSAIVTASLFDVLQARAVIGKLFSRDDDAPGKPAVAVLSSEYFQRRFGGDSSVIGKNLQTDDQPMQVIGIAEPGLTLPLPGPFASQTNLTGFGVDIWLPMRLNAAGPFYNSHPNVGIARLRPGITSDSAQHEFSNIMRSFSSALPAVYSDKFLKSYNFRVEVSDLRNTVLGPKIPRILWLVLGSVVLVLLIAVANVANLLVVRLQARRRESAIRTALGASGMHMAIHFLSESLLLCTVSGLGGVLLAYVGLRGLLRIAPTSVPRLESLSISTASVGVAFGIAVLLGALLGLIPFLASVGPNTLRENGRALSSSRRQTAVRNGLVVGQVALALVLLACASLMTQSFLRLRDVRPGFDATNVTAFNISLPFNEYDTREKALTFHRELQREIAEIPGVTSVGAMGEMPLEDFGIGCSVVFHEGGYADGEKVPCVPTPTLAPGFFETLKIPVQGRVPTWSDFEQRTHVAVVTKAFADRMFPGENAIGKRINPNGQKATTSYDIVGIIPELRAEALENPPTEAVFYAQAGFKPDEKNDSQNDLLYFVRTAQEPTPALMKRIGAFAQQLNPRVPLMNARTMSQVVERSISRTSFIMILLGGAAAFAVVLSAVGMYGVISYVVALRRNEIGLRLALGAQHGGVVRLVVAQSMRLAMFGVVIGAVGAYVVGKALTSLLYEVSPSNPATLAAVSMLLLSVAALASFAPARRASRVDPLEAMRSD